MTGIFPSQYDFNELPENTVVPIPSEDEDDFIFYLNRLYEDIAFAVNNKDNVFFPISISDGAVNIPNLPNFGAFIICVSGQENGMPSYVWALSKATINAAGTAVILTNQVGTIAPWIGATLTITDSGVVNGVSNYQIRHSVAGTTGNFNIRYLTTI